VARDVDSKRGSRECAHAVRRVVWARGAPSSGPGVIAASLTATAILSALAALATAALLGAWYNRRLGGYTGDTLGATQQITEIVFYLTWLAAWNSH